MLIKLATFKIIKLNIKKENLKQKPNFQFLFLFMSPFSNPIVDGGEEPKLLNQVLYLNGGFTTHYLCDLELTDSTVYFSEN